MNIFKNIKCLLFADNYDAVMARVEHQRAYGVAMEKFSDADGRVKARVCKCGFFRRDIPPGYLVCGCGAPLHDSPIKLMCPACSALIIEGRSSWATYNACEQCR